MRVLSQQFGELVPATPVQHVWVDVTGRWVDPSPGLLLMWRRRLGKRAGWDGWVMHCDPAGPTLSQGWVDARLVRPARHKPPVPDLSGYRPSGNVPT